MKSILDKDFVYKNSAETDVAATFRRIRRELAKAKAIAAASNVQALPVKQRKGKA